ncbi:adenosine kinase, partial [Asbolus verrucosus]
HSSDELQPPLIVATFIKLFAETDLKVNLFLDTSSISCVFRKTFVVFIGSPLMDIVARVDDRFLSRYSLQPDNAYSVDETNRNIFEEIKNNKTQIGGSVTNSVRVFRKLKDFPVAYLGSIGRDSYGQLIKRKLELEGIGSDLMEIQTENTGKVAVLLRGKARTLVTDLGASRVFPADEKMWKKIREASHIYLSAFFIGVSFATITRIVEDGGKTIAINLGAPFLCAKYPEEVTYLYSNSSLVFGNEAEHRAFARLHNVAHKDLAEAVVGTNNSHGGESRVVVVTRGDKSVLVVRNGECEEFEVEPLDQSKIVDSNGAGDAFVGGFLSRYVAGESVANCVRCGIRVAQSKLCGGDFRDYATV